MDVTPSTLFLSLALWFVDDVANGIPSNEVCQREYWLSRNYVSQCEKHFVTWNGWQNELEMIKARRREQLWWAVWWVSCPESSAIERQRWYGISVLLRFGG